jgi:hypothetical protein
MGQLEDLRFLLATNSLNLPNDAPLGKVPDPVEFVEQLQFAALEKAWGWDEQIGTNDLEKRAKAGAHADGIEIRKLDDGDYWKNTYRNGELVQMELCYANGQSERFDADGNKMA